MKNKSDFITGLLFCVSLVFVIACQPKTVNSEEINTYQKKETPAEPTPLTNDGYITIAAVGDIMLGSPFPNDSRMPPNDGADILKDTTPILKSADIAFGNLEGPLADGGISEKCGTGRPNCYAFRMPTRYGNYLKDAGFDILNLANNHAGDFGDSGRASTRKTLDEIGIKHAGSDKNQFSTAYLQSSGKTIAFIGFAHNNISLNVNDLSAARKAVLDADKKADIVVVSFHGGAEGANYQRVPKQTEIYLGESRGNLPLFARTVIDSGADLVIGHGPHVLRGMEIYKDRLIAYSLGNFATYGWFKLIGGTAESLVLETKLDKEGKFVEGKIHPVVQQDWGVPRLDKTNSAITTIKRLSSVDFAADAPKISGDGLITAK